MIYADRPNSLWEGIKGAVGRWWTSRSNQQ